MEEQKETAAQRTGMGVFLSGNSQGSFYLGKIGKSYNCPLQQWWELQRVGYIKSVLLDV